jgi:hypothetical protein
VVILNNGGERYADKYAREERVEVINNQINIGCGAGTVQLFSQCQSEYAFYIQVDHELANPVYEADIRGFVDLIENQGYTYVDLAGNQGNGGYSERAQFIGRDFYLTVPKNFGGPGPLDDLKWTEECVQNYLEAEDLNRFYTVRLPNGSPLFIDKGRDSVRSNPDGSCWKHHPDTKVVYCLKKPTERFSFPPLDESEWQLALGGNWPEEGRIINAWADNSFEVWNKKPATIDPSQLDGTETPEWEYWKLNYENLMTFEEFEENYMVCPHCGGYTENNNPCICYAR